MPDPDFDFDELLESRPRYDKRRQCREYYDGDHDTQLTSRQRKYLQIKTGQEFNDNYMPIVADALAERLTVTGFRSQEEGQGTILWQWWKASRLDAGQSDVHLAAVRDGDAYALVDWDPLNARPRITFEPAFDGTEGAEVLYGDNRREPRMAFKRWKSIDDTERMNVYLLGQVQRYQRGDGDWQLLAAEPWPFGQIPLFHFRNRSDGYNYGKSELHDVIPLQNALNKSIIDVVAAADTTGFRLYWMTGDDPSALDLVPGSWVYSENADTKMGFFQGEDLTQLIGFKDMFAMEIARVSRTPLSFFQLTGQVAAEGTLKQQESGLVSRAKKRQVEFGNTWEDVMSFARQMHNLYSGQPTLDEATPIDAAWEDPETRDDLGRLQELKIKSELGIPDEQIWSEMGYDEAQIEQFQADGQRQARIQRSKFETAGAGLNAGLPTEQVMRQMGMTDEEIQAMYEEVQQ